MEVPGGVSDPTAWRHVRLRQPLCEKNWQDRE